MALEGTLQDMSLGDLFQVFRMGPKTGVLLLVASDRRGIIHVADGRVIDAVIVRSADRAVAAAHEEAVLQMLGWDEAEFVFRHDPAVRGRPVRVSHESEWLVLEGLRRREDPTRAAPYQRITLETKLQHAPLPSGTESGVSLTVVQWRVLSQIASSPQLGAVCAATGLAHEQVIRAAAELVAIGMVEVVAAPAPRPRAHAPRPDPVAAVVPAMELEPSLARVTAETIGESGERPQIGRGLLDAMIRRVRAL